MKATLGLVAAWLLLTLASPALAGEKYAVVISGASGGPPYSEKYESWRTKFVKALQDRLGYRDDRVFVFAEHESRGVVAATRANVQHLFAELRTRLSGDDQLFVLLIGHGTIDGDEAKFNLVGPDLGAADWAALLKPISARTVFVNAASGSFPFLHALAARGRIVITANDSVAQQFETVFPQFFVDAFTDAAADGDKDGRVSTWEAFVYTSARVRQWYMQQGQLATERALLDDTGSGVGRDSQAPGKDGTFAKVTTLQPEVPLSASGDPAMAALLKRRSELERQLAELQSKKDFMLPDQYTAAVEKVLVELAKVNQEIRSK
jgi:hypothetical protein